MSVVSGDRLVTNTLRALAGVDYHGGGADYDGRCAENRIGKQCSHNNSTQAQRSRNVARKMTLRLTKLIFR